MVDFGPDVYINAYPNWPPAGSPDHLVLHYSNGTVIWGKPSYGSPDCQDYMHCQRATFILNPTWQKCAPQGHILEVVTLDGLPVLNSSLLQLIDPQTKKTGYLAFSGGTWFAGPDLASVAAQVKQAQSTQAAQPAQTAQGSNPYLQSGTQAFGTALGVTLAAALALGAVYLAARQQNLNYMASQPHPYTCTSRYVGSYWTTNCNPY